MGTMFFANPVAALRNVREALVPGGLLNMVVWRRKLDNEFMHRAELVVAEYLDEPEESEAPRCGPGPFSMANADTVSDVLTHAGYEQIRLARQDLPYKIGDSLEQAVAFNMALGPAAEVLRMWGNARRRDQAANRRCPARGARRLRRRRRRRGRAGIDLGDHRPGPALSRLPL